MGSHSADHVNPDVSAARGPPGRWGTSDAILIGLIIVVWFVWLYPAVTARRPVGFDTFRDTAAVENILAGRWFCDPSVEGQTYWYAPLGPILFAAISYLTGRDPLAVYSSSILWLNVFLPIGWYVLARLWWGRAATALAAVLMVWLGSRWWSTHAALPITSVQGVILLMVTLVGWQWSLRHRRRWAVAVGVLLALCTWYHILSGILAAAAIAFHALCGAADAAPDRRAAPVGRMLIAAGVCGLLVAPLAWHMLALPRVNPAPIEYLADELRDPAFALHAQTPLLLPLALLGLIDILQNKRRCAGLLLTYALVSLIGLGLGYVRILAGIRVPVVTPHEFQWNLQIATGLLAAGGAARLADWIARRVASWKLTAAPPRRPILVLLVVIALWGDAEGALRRKADYWLGTRAPRSTMQVIKWIKRNTSIDDVFLGAGPTDYFVIAGRTGRKLVCPPAGHANLAVSVGQRSRDKRRMFETEDLAAFRGLLATYGVDYVLLMGEQPQIEDGWQARWQALGVFEPVFSSDPGNVTIYRVRHAPGR